MNANKNDTPKKYNLNLALKDNLEYSDRILRWLSLRISRFIVKYTNISPNAITIFSLILALCGGIFFLRGGYLNLVIGGLLAFSRQIFDQVDGEVARMKQCGSVLGQWLDGITGLISTEVLIICLTVGLGNITAYFWGILAAIAYPMHYWSVYSYKYEILKEFKSIDISQNKKLDFLKYVYGSALFYLILPLGMIINKPLWVLIFFGIVGNIFWMGIMAIQYRSIKSKAKVNLQSAEIKLK